MLRDAGGVLAVAKPAGLPTQAPPGCDSAESIVRRWRFVVAADGGGRHPGGFLGVPHRLDRPVSGVLLLATTPRAARHLSRQFERRQVTKTYLARLGPAAGSGPALAVGDTFEWRDTVRKVPDEARAAVVAAGTADGREAVTAVRIVAITDGIVHAELAPTTGRMHQLRVQAAARGMPVLGDTLYGSAHVWAAASADVEHRCRPIALHAWRIAFTDPDTGLPTDVTCPLPFAWDVAKP